MKRAAIALGAAILLMASAAMAARRQQQSNPAARALVAKALAASNIESKTAPAFFLQARIRTQFPDEGPQSGKLVWVETPAGWWHKELMLSAYQSFQISGGKQVWSKSTANYLPFPVFLIERATYFLDWLRKAGGQKLSDPETSAETGETCVKTTKHSDPLTYCFDSLSGNLIRMVDRWWNVTFRYSEYAPFGTKSFPRLIEVVRSDGSVLIQIRVVGLAKEEKPDLRLFLPVKGAKAQPSEANCGKIIDAKLNKMVPPRYPGQAGQAGIIGVVKLYAYIGVDGVPRGMWLVNSATPVLAHAALDAVRRWRYEARTCKATGAKLQQVQIVTVIFDPH